MLTTIKTKWFKNNLVTFFAFSLAPFQALASAPAPVPDFLHNSVFHKTALKTDIDPLLLYSISLVESAKYRGNSTVAPSKYALRAGDKSYYPTSKPEAKKILNGLIDSGLTNIDVGLMQVNLRWHGHRVNSPHDLFNAETNLSVASDILMEAMLSSPMDIKTAIGRYHNWTDVERANAYAGRVLRVYTNINNGRY